MAAAVTTVTKLDDGFFLAKYHVRVQHTDTQITTPVTIIDASTLKGADPEATLHELQIHSVEWNSSDVDGILNLLFNATSDQQALACIGYRGSHHGFLIKPAAADGLDGDIQITTSGHVNPSTLEAIVTVRKGAGFLTVPYVTDADITNTDGAEPPAAVTLFVTGDVIEAEANLAGEPALVRLAPNLELKLSDGGSPAVITTALMQYAGLIGNVESLLFALPVTDAHVAEVGDAEFGAIVPQGAASISSGFAQSPARLTPFDSDIAAIEINPNRILSAAFSNDNASEQAEPSDLVWFEGENVTLAVTFGQPQVVTVDAGISIEVNGDAGSVEFAYVSGSGTRTLIFAATIPDDQGAQGETSECDLTAGITFAGDDAIESSLTDVEPAGVSDADWSDFITVASLAINPEPQL